MASLTLKKDCKNWIACFDRTQRSTGIPKDGDKKLAQKIANEYEQASKMAKAGTLNPTNARKILNTILSFTNKNYFFSKTS